MFKYSNYILQMSADGGLGINGSLLPHMN